MQGPLRWQQHQFRDSLRWYSSRLLEARRPVTFGGLSDGADGPVCRAALRAASTELEKSLLHGRMVGALWTTAMVSGHGMRTNSARPQGGAAREDEVHVLWDHRVRNYHMDMAALAQRRGDGNLPPRAHAPVAIVPAEGSLFPLRLAHGLDRGLLDEFLCRLYGMYLAVLAAHMAASEGGQPGRRAFPFGPVASAAPQPLHVGRLRQPPAGGHSPPPATAPAGDPARPAMAPRLHPPLSLVGPGAGVDAGAGGRLPGRVGPRL